MNELAPENTLPVTCFRIFLDEAKRNSGAQEAILPPPKGDSKKRTAVEFNDPSISAPETLQFLDIGEVQMTETMQNDWDQQRLLIEVNRLFICTTLLFLTLTFVGGSFFNHMHAYFIIS